MIRSAPAVGQIIKKKKRLNNLLQIYYQFLLTELLNDLQCFSFPGWVLHDSKEIQTTSCPQ